jgi:hypothetical protein
MRRKSFGWPILCLALIALSGCGGSGGATPTPTQGTDVTNNGSTATGGTTSLSAPTKGVLKMATAGAAGTIAGIDVTVNLPAGVTVAADPVTGEVANGAVTLSGVAAVGSLGAQNVIVAKYTPAASTVATSQLHIVMANVSGFGVGEFATVNFDLATGTALPVADAFSVMSCVARGGDGAVLSGVTAAPASVAGI